MVRATLRTRSWARTEKPSRAAARVSSFLARRRERAVARELARRHAGVDADGPASEARPLAFAGAGNPPLDRGRVCRTGARKGHLGRHRPHVDVEVDPV